jgi:hypothetical protein
MVSRFLWTLLPFGTLTDNSLDSLRVNKNIILQSSSHSVWPQVATSVLKPVLFVGTEQKFLQFWFVLHHTIKSLQSVRHINVGFLQTARIHLLEELDPSIAQFLHLSVHRGLKKLQNRQILLTCTAATKATRTRSVECLIVFILQQLNRQF